MNISDDSGYDDNTNENKFVSGVEDKKIEVETPIEFNQFLIEPTAERFFYWITKDINITYLDETDLERVRMLCEIIVTLHYIGLHKNAMEFFGDLSAIVNTASARHGFMTQMQHTSITKGFQYFDGVEEEKVNRGG